VPALRCCQGVKSNNITSPDLPYVGPLRSEDTRSGVLTGSRTRVMGLQLAWDTASHRRPAVGGRGITTTAPAEMGVRADQHHLLIGALGRR
jgi:hypothetical protein